MKLLNLFSLLLLCMAQGCSSKGNLDNTKPDGEELSTTLTVDPTLQSHMVLQQNRPFKISGKGTPGQYVTIKCSWEAQEGSAQVLANGTWSHKAKAPAGGFDAHQVTVSGRQQLVFDDILSGEVWVCAGQSNMWWPMKDTEGGLTEMVNAKPTLPIRLLQMPQEQSPLPVADLSAQWQPCTAGTLEWFSAVAYFFGKQLVETLQVPVGLINTSWGDTTAEVWAARDAVLGNTAVRDVALKNDATPRADPQAPYKIGAAFNAMIYPLRDIAVAGAIWYQGESNMDTPANYPGLLAALVQSWRAIWEASSAEFPFYIAQICPYRREFSYQVNYANPNMRFAQQQASLAIANSGVICNDDIGNAEDIHPKNKRDVGKRFAYLALSNTYGYAQQPLSPLYLSHQLAGNAITVQFVNAASGLETADGLAPTLFEIAGADRIFHPARAVIADNAVTLTSAAVAQPLHARLGWSYTRNTNLRSKEGQPVSVFKTYDWKEETEEHQ